MTKIILSDYEMKVPHHENMISEYKERQIKRDFRNEDVALRTVEKIFHKPDFVKKADAQTEGAFSKFLQEADKNRPNVETPKRARYKYVHNLLTYENDLT